MAPAPRTPPPAPSCRARSAWVGVAPAGGGWRQRAFLSRMTPTLNPEHFHCRNRFKQRQDAASAARSRGYRKYPMAGAGRSVTERAAGGIMNWRCRDGAVGTRRCSSRPMKPRAGHEANPGEPRGEADKPTPQPETSAPLPAAHGPGRTRRGRTGRGQLWTTSPGSGRRRILLKLARDTSQDGPRSGP